MAEKPEDFNLPISVVARIAKEVLPDGVIVSKEARAALSKAASIFVLYATSSANNFAMQANRKTLSGQDIFSALADLEFEHFVDPLQVALEAFRKDKQIKAASKKARNSTDKDISKDNQDDEVDIPVIEVPVDEDETSD